LLEEIKKVLAEQLCISSNDIGVNSRIVEDLGVDSIDVIELVISLEELYDIEIMDEESEKISTVEDIVKIIKKKVG